MVPTSLPTCATITIITIDRDSNSITISIYIFTQREVIIIMVNNYKIIFVSPPFPSKCLTLNKQESIISFH